MTVGFEEQLEFFEKQRIHFLDQYIPVKNSSRQQRAKAEELIDNYMSLLRSLIYRKDSNSTERALIGTSVKIRYEDGGTDDFVLCFPHEADPSRGFLSFLSPIGMGLLMSEAGSSFCVSTPSGEETITVLSIDSFTDELKIS